MKQKRQRKATETVATQKRQKLQREAMKQKRQRKATETVATQKRQR